MREQTDLDEVIVDESKIIHVWKHGLEDAFKEISQIVVTVWIQPPPNHRPCPLFSASLNGLGRNFARVVCTLRVRREDARLGVWKRCSVKCVEKMLGLPHTLGRRGKDTIMCAEIMMTRHEALKRPPAAPLVRYMHVANGLLYDVCAPVSASVSVEYL